MTLTARLLLLAALTTFTQHSLAAVIAEWDFEGDFTDSASNFYHLNKANPSGLSFVSGVDGGSAVNFNGQNFLYDTAPGLTASRSHFSVGTWFKSDQLQTGDAILLGHFWDGGHAYRHGVTLHKDDLVGYVRTGANNANTTGISGFNTNDGQWHHVVQTFNGSVIRLYFDGVQVASRNSAYPTSWDANGNSEFSLGGRSILSNGFVGSLDKAFFANHAMSASEVNALYTSVPVPASGWLLLAGLLVLAKVRRTAV